jgi:hypothetical protein
MTTHFPISYTFGKKNETIVLPIITRHFQKEIKEYKEQYSKFDFFDDEYDYELKSRTNKYKTYPTTMITANKVSGDKKKIFLFYFTDGLYYIEYNKEIFDNYELKMVSRSGLEAPKPHFLIPIEDLIEIKTHII